LRVAFLRGGAHQFKRVPGFPVGGHYLEAKRIILSPGEHKLRILQFVILILILIRPAKRLQLRVGLRLRTNCFHFRANELPVTKSAWQHH
ncbi:MAG TPA: hypothetical protein VF492_04275, partial [Verrucomicrobiae bacterium]